jgi:hypothetical protein
MTLRQDYLSFPDLTHEPFMSREFLSAVHRRQKSEICLGWPERNQAPVIRTSDGNQVMRKYGQLPQ